MLNKRCKLVGRAASKRPWKVLSAPSFSGQGRFGIWYRSPFGDPLARAAADSGIHELMASNRPPSQTLQQRYGRGYYHGQQSGYPRQGYSVGHQDWTPWLEFLHSLQPHGTLLDLGCAYGYLPAQARQMGFRAFGADISQFALRQEPGFHPFLCQAHLESLPFADRCADLVCLFDVLEHLDDPMQALWEAKRILKPNGLLAGATPDPIFFPSSEPTHCFERPPSFWIDALESLGLAVQFRFSAQAYNFQFLAAFPESPNLSRLNRFQHDYFSSQPDFIQTSGPLTALPRSGWSSLSAQGRSIQGDSASIYLLNRHSAPLRVQGHLELEGQDYTPLRVLWNSQVIGEFLPAAAQPLKGEYRLQEFLLPSGGHHLFFQPLNAGLRIKIARVRLQASASDPSRLTQTLPFDLFQRYQLASEISRPLKPATILDWGGVLGDEGGHLAVPQDFLAADGACVASADIRHCDHPRHVPLTPQAEWPDKRTFDLVLSLDVLEHIPQAQRPGFLAKLDDLSRRWIILGAPFASPEVAAAEKLLGEGLMSAQRFLQEHLELGLPDKQLIQGHYGPKGYQVLAFPNGWLPLWLECQALTQHYFTVGDYATATLFNRLCNQHFCRCDRREPCYRTLYLICKEPLPSGLEADLRDRLIPPPDDSPSARPPRLSSDPGFLHLLEQVGQLQQRRRSVCRDACFLLKEREKHVALLQETAAELERQKQAPLYKIIIRRLRGQQ